MPCLNRSKVKNMGILIIGAKEEWGFYNLGKKKTEYKKKNELIYFIIEDS